jgi:type IX secretion system PorP/SprF family membrane protein
MNRLVPILLFMTILSVTTRAQDISFSQKFVSSPYLNPALTGIFNGSVRLGIQYRSQWAAPLDASFQSYAASGDLKYNLNLFDETSRDILGVGIQFVNDRIEGIDFNTTLIGLTSAFHKSLNNRFDHYLGVGFQAGIIQKNVNYEQLQFADQYNNIDAFSFPTAEPLPTNNFAIEDFSVGILYLVSPNHRFSYRGGLAYQHLSGPNVSFFRFNEDFPKNDIIRKFTFHSTASFEMGPYTALLPRLIILSQGPFLDAEIGANVKFTTFTRDNITFHLGLGANVSRDLESVDVTKLIPFVGFQLNNFLIGMSYDVGLNTLIQHNRNYSTFEFSLSYLGEYDNQPLFCPKF